MPGRLRTGNIKILQIAADSFDVFESFQKYQENQANQEDQTYEFIQINEEIQWHYELYSYQCPQIHQNDDYDQTLVVSCSDTLQGGGNRSHS